MNIWREKHPKPLIVTTLFIAQLNQIGAITTTGVCLSLYIKFICCTDIQRAVIETQPLTSNRFLTLTVNNEQCRSIQKEELETRHKTSMHRPPTANGSRDARVRDGLLCVCVCVYVCETN
jgi:hypothetical protein